MKKGVTMSKMYPKTEKGGFAIKLLSQISPVVFFTNNENTLKKVKTIFNISTFIYTVTVLINYQYGSLNQIYPSKLLFIILTLTFFILIHLFVFFSDKNIEIYDINIHGKIIT